MELLATVSKTDPSGHPSSGLKQCGFSDCEVGLSIEMVEEFDQRLADGRPPWLCTIGNSEMDEQFLIH
jgi:hypothetical protein